MRNIVVAVVWICLVGTYSQLSVTARIVPDEKTVHGAIQVNEQYDKAFLNNDAETLKRLLADDFTYIRSSGEIVDKDKYIEGVKYSGEKYESQTSSEVKGRMYGDTVVLTGRLFASWRYQNQDNSGRYRYTRVYVWRQDRWLLAAGQSTRLNE